MHSFRVLHRECFICLSFWQVVASALATAVLDRVGAEAGGMIRTRLGVVLPPNPATIVVPGGGGGLSRACRVALAQSGAPPRVIGCLHGDAIWLRRLQSDHRAGPLPLFGVRPHDDQHYVAAKSAAPETALARLVGVIGAAKLLALTPPTPEGWARLPAFGELDRAWLMTFSAKREADLFARR